MRRANPLWGAPRIHGELLKLAIKASEATVYKYTIRRSRPLSLPWCAIRSARQKQIPIPYPSSESKLLPLQFPDPGKGIHKVGKGQSRPMGAIEDGLLDVRGQQRQPRMRET